MATHKELITERKFDGSFKNALRDYYSYGFKKLSDYDSKQSQTLTADWNRLNNILSDYMKWSDKEVCAEKMYITQESLAMSENPFHRVYRFCKFNHNDPMIFFNIVFALSDNVGIAGQNDTYLYERLNIDIQKEAKRRSRYQYIEFFVKNHNKNICLVEKSQKVSSQKNYYLETGNREFIKIPHKDEAFVKILYKYWDFVKKHTDISISKKNEIVGFIDGKKESIEIPSSNMDECEIAESIVNAHGKLNKYASTYISNTVDFLETQFEILLKTIEGKEGLSSSQLQCFYPNEVALFTGDNNAINSKLHFWKQMRILEKVPYGGTDKKVAENRWKLCNFVIEDLIEKGQEINPDFETVFQTALDFYSKYFVLGVCGTFIQDRLGSENRTAFRFKHEYFMQTLNDFNLIDLLYAIENDKWCKIKYKHGTANFDTELLCKPLELRISSATGREYLVFYNPLKRSYTSLRLEFIESIYYFTKADILKVISLSENEINQDIENAKQALKYLWGVSTTAKQVHNAVLPITPTTVKLQIAYDIDKEYYIKERLLRESRRNGVQVLEEEGIINFIALVSDPKEMRPWIRSLYSRILSCEGIEIENFSLMQDVEKCIKSLNKIKKEIFSESQRWSMDEATVNGLGNGEKARAHEELFNEIFSVYYYIISETIMQCCSKFKEKEISENDLKKVINKVQGWFEYKKGYETDKFSADEIEWLIQNNAFGRTINKAGKMKTSFKYICNLNLEFYRNILPLTKLEIRWLKTILSDEKMKYFLSEEEIALMKKTLDVHFPDVTVLPMDKIVYYDRFLVSFNLECAEREVMATIVNGIYDESVLKISYITRSGTELTGKFRPIVLEFSKRNNKFQACFQSCDNERIYYINLLQINYILITKERFDYSKVLEQYEEYRKMNERSVKIGFYNVRNLTDRILTEFSPWKKYCTYNQKSNLYTLEIFYQKVDQLDLVIRLMGYGSSIYFLDKEHSIFKEIQLRLNRQRDIIREQHREAQKEDNR